MRIDQKMLKHLDVETVSGEMLGHIYDFVMEIEGQIIVQYKVKPSLISRMDYLVSRDQIVKFTSYKVIVDDAVVPEKKVELSKKIPAEIESVAMMKKS